MYYFWIFALSAIFVTVQSLPAGLNDEAKKAAEQPSRPKVKRSQELLMFGNQQNHQQVMPNTANNNIVPTMEKRTLSNSGLEDVSAVLSEAEQQAVNRPKALPSTYIMDQPAMPAQHDKNYEYGKVLINELDDVVPRGRWDYGPGPALYGRYYGGLSAEDRRKRSEDSNSPIATSSSSSVTSSASPSSSAAPASTGSSSTATPAAVAAGSQASQQLQQLTQPKRSIPSYYQEYRYKRESDIDPDKQLYALLSLYNSEHRNRGNWRNYGSDEYENVDDDSNMISLDDEDPSGSWLDSPVGYPQQQPQHRFYSSAEPLLNSELAALGHARPLSYYDQYLSQQYGGGASAAGQQYDSGVQYGTPQYGIPYNVHSSYYPPEKRYVLRKRSQDYNSYGGRNGLLLNTRAYPGYQHRLLY